MLVPYLAKQFGQIIFIILKICQKLLVSGIFLTNKKPFNMVGFDLMTCNYAGEDDTTRPVARSKIGLGHISSNKNLTCSLAGFDLTPYTTRPVARS
jgi:hypothetical protein